MSNWKNTFLLRYFGFTKIPMIFFARPQVLHINERSCEIKIPLRRRTRNHLKSMYIATLIMGADLSAGLLGMDLIQKSGHHLSLVFKDVHGDFLKRVDGHAHFVCDEGPSIQALINEVIQSGERQHRSIPVNVYAPDKYGNEILATISLTLSLKDKNQ